MGDQKQKREETGAIEVVDIPLTAKSPSRRRVGQCFKVLD
jgi:hypothetical protein